MARVRLATMMSVSFYRNGEFGVHSVCMCLTAQVSCAGLHPEVFIATVSLVGMFDASKF